MQDQRPRGRSESDASELLVDGRLLGQSQDDGLLPGWAAAAVRGELTRDDDPEDKTVSHRTASDTAVSSEPDASLPAWARRAMADESLLLTTTVQPPADQNTITSVDGRIPVSRATWGPVVPPAVRPQLLSAADSNIGSASVAAADCVCSETSVHFDGKDLNVLVDKPGIGVFSGSSMLNAVMPNASSFVTKPASLQDSDDKLADAPLLSAADATCNLTDVVLEEEPSGPESGKVSEPRSGKQVEQLQKQTAYRHVSEESTETGEQRHVCVIVDQHVGKETVSVDERRYVKMVADQSVGSETSQVEDRLHVGMSSSASAVAESQEMPEHAAVKPVDGQHVSRETVAENAAKPCIRMRAERRTVTESESSLSVCSVSV